MKPTETSPLFFPQPTSENIFNNSYDIRQRKSGATMTKIRSRPLQATQRKTGIAEVLGEGERNLQRLPSINSNDMCNKM